MRESGHGVTGSKIQNVAGWRTIGRGRTIALAVLLGFGSVGTAVVAATPAGAAKPGAASPGPTHVAQEPQSPHIRANIAGPGPSNVFVTNSTTDTATGFPTSASGNATPSYGVGGVSTSPNFAEAEVLDAAGNLWVANGNNTIAEYAKSALAQSGNPVPVVVLTSTAGRSIDSPSGLAFDSAGDLWVTNSGLSSSGSVVEFAPGQLAASGNPAPAVTISSNGTNIHGPYGLAFDSSGNLWVFNYSGNTVVKFAANQLGTSGTTIPAVTLTMPGSGPSSCGPNGAAFDASGNLWVPCYSQNEVVEIAQSSLGATGTPIPAVTLTANSNSLNEPEYATFDSSGNLWVVNSGSSTVVEFTAAQLTSPSPVPAVTLSPAGVGSPTVSLSAPYQLIFDSSGNAWVVNQGSLTISAFAPSQYAASGSPAPAIQITPAFGLDTPQLETFDSSGNLWIANLATSSLVAFTPSQLAAGATRPAIALELPSADSPGGVAFDGSGDLWVSDLNNDAIYEFTPAQLSASGSPTPKVSITGTGPSLSGSSGLAFDTSGDLWVANRSNSTMVEFTPTQLAASGSPTPATTISSDGSHSLVNPTGATFDAAGNLWISNARSGTASPGPSLVEYTSAQLAAGTGSPTPNVTITPDGSGSLDTPLGLGFDASGDLWVANEGNNSLVEFAPTQLVTGSPTPLSTVAGSATQLDSPVGVAIPPLNVRPATSGYWLAAADGGIFSFGNHPFFGSMGGKPLDKPVVGMAPTPVFGSTGGRGYWEVAADGGIFSFGDAQFHGSMGGKPLNKPVVGMAPTPDGSGYWEVASDGGVFNFGDAHFYGSTGAMHLNAPVVGMASTADGNGYWLVAADGGIFSYGDAAFYGSMGGTRLNKPVVGMASTADGKGYWLVASDGGIFSFGDAQFQGSMGGKPLNKPVVGLSPTNDGKGYWEVATDGGIFSFGNAAFEGSMGGKPLNQPVVSMAN
jgi:sugar lactone lactonase YvrE